MFDLYRAEDFIEQVEAKIKYGIIKQKPMKQKIKTGIDLISEERADQLTKHKRTVEQDRLINDEGQLPDAASVLCMNVPESLQGAYLQHLPPVGWDKTIWKAMLKKPYKERLAIAGALIAAEIDRITE